MIEFDGTSQSIGNESDEAQFVFGNADRVMRDLTNEVDLFRAALEFSLFHVGTGTMLDPWKGDIVNWSFDAGPEFKVTAADGLYELNLLPDAQDLAQLAGLPLLHRRRARPGPLPKC